MVEIIVAIITGGLSILGVIITNHNSNRKMQSAMEVQQAVINTKIDNLTDRVEKHNQVIERTYAAEKDITLLKEKQAVANHRIDDLEKKVG
ncbi:MAG: hypothetical protein PUE56_04340 [Clostridium sp.]|nr:hypothetical protein [Clostridium sp.]